MNIDKFKYEKLTDKIRLFIDDIDKMIETENNMEDFPEIVKGFSYVRMNYIRNILFALLCETDRITNEDMT